ncbi:FAD-dependent oxidoreductase [Monoglobus pectinilyticus]|uniref:Dihydrolipoyl dehydrogenase n=1 Tax=Monoglobus pectinilyticus TaxID=1981510 RepID=A0A2K9P0R8_9FIRM|nr:FAD-dependent oxidoreductase [Monoglobus pectinilyticus]AUO18853.1 dihydrolipoyl dehydrogenase [Monoglobus pectinilyticus]
MKYDAVIIGFGKGGKTLAGKLAKTGKSVALIEKDPNMYGGTCINVGCIPSKSLIHSAASANPYGDAAEKEKKYREAIEEKRRLTKMLRTKNYDKLASSPNITIYNGTARFAERSKIEVKTGGKSIIIEGDKIFINTGSTPRIPPISGLSTTSGIYTSAELMDLDNFPEKLTIIGGGYIGLEFASMFSGFGSDVTVIQDGETFLPREDEDIAGEIKAILEKSGVKFRLGAKIKYVDEGPKVVFEWNKQDYSLESDAVLAATGRIPNTSELNCQAAGIELTSKQAVKVDQNLRTTAENVWAMGDVTGGLQHTYISLDDSRIVWSQLSGSGNYTADSRRNVPYSVFLSTPYSRVGMNEKEAQKSGIDYITAALPVSTIPKAQVLKSTDGILKALIDKNTNKILGAMLLCAESYEVINIIKLAMDMDADYTVLRDRIFTHPTMAEALNDLFTL